jgi:predicted ArsR family transcriptional regulator
MSDTRLTPSERATLEMLRRMTDENGPPSMSQLAKRMGLQRAGVQRHFQALKVKGAITGPKWVGDWRITATGKSLLRGG